MATKYNQKFIELLETLNIAVPNNIRADQQLASDLFDKVQVAVDALIASNGADAVGDALVTEVLDGKIFSTAAGVGLVGTLTLADLTDDATAVAAEIASSKTAYVNGELLVGTYDFATATAGDATAADIAEGKTAYVNGVLIVGTAV